MCGIAGIFDTTGPPIRFDVLVEMTQMQAHRGPDGEGYALLDPARRQKPFTIFGSPSSIKTFVPGYAIGFGHRRLAIVDPSPLGHQPMTTADGRCWITYNGEIYNHTTLRQELQAKGYRFRSVSDTEVVLAAYCEWGTSCLSRLNGMFAFAIWDSWLQRLFCARDRFGIKPFVYSWDGSTFAFASEIKGLLPVLNTRSPNPRAVFQYLEGAYLDCSEDTFLEGINQLSPASYLLLENGRLTQSTYWSLEPAEGNGYVTAKDAAQDFLDLFADAVRLRLQCDVPVGFGLSGGLDSSSIVCVASKLLQAGRDGAGVHTFSSSFDEPACDERAFITPVVAHTNASAHFVRPDPLELAAMAETLVWQVDEPFGSTSIFAHWNVMRLAAQHGTKVMLNGQGADEHLAGYHGFFGAWFADLLTQLRWRTLVHELSAYYRLHKSLSKYAVANVERGLLPWWLIRSIRSRMIHSDTWIAKPFREAWGPLPIKGFETGPCFQALQHELLTGNGLRALLRFEDRNAMAFGIETRLPFLDHRLVEFVYRLPEACKLSRGWTKMVLREAMEGILPEDVRWRPDKMGFPTPEDAWFRTSLNGWVREILADRRTRERGYLNVDAAFEELDAHQARRTNLSATIWKWVNLELWCRCFLDQDPCAIDRSIPLVNQEAVTTTRGG